MIRPPNKGTDHALGKGLTHPEDCIDAIDGRMTPKQYLD